MAQVTYLRKLPQQYALTGLRARTPIYEKYGQRGPTGIPSLASLTQAPTINPYPTIKRVPPKLTPDTSGGPGIGLGEGSVGGFEGNAPAPTDPNDVGTIVGNQIAGSTIGRGVSKGIETGILANLANLPSSMVPSVVAQSAVLSALSPIALANVVGGSAISGNAAQEAQNALQAENISPDLTGQTVQGIVDALPSTLFGHAISSIAGKQSPKEFSKDVTELTIANAPFATPGNTVDTSLAALAPQGPNIPGTSMVSSESAFSQDPSFVSDAAIYGGGTSGGGSGGNVGPGGGNTGTGVGGYGGGEAGLASGPAGGGGDGGGTVICTELHRQGLMSDEVYEADSKYGKRLSQDVINGYHVFGKPLAKLMARSKIVTAIIKPPAIAWANQMSFREGVTSKPNIAGAIIEFIGIPMCKLINRMVNRGLSRSQHPNQLHSFS